MVGENKSQYMNVEGENIVRRLMQFKEEPDDTSINLIVVLRDEELLIEYFIQHYLDLGVTHFTFIDNGSKDNTLSIILNTENINCQVFYTQDSYAENQYGISWVTEIMNTQFKDKWCVVVDSDELIMPFGGETLNTIRYKLESKNQNILPTCLVDFYPKTLDYKIYESGTPFYIHSNYYDKFLESNYLIYLSNLGGGVVKGGLRHRAYGSDTEPVCLTKKSFFKYDFYRTHELSVGMHFILPIDFNHADKSEWGTYKNSRSMCSQLKPHQNLCLVGHFKFIKPNIYDFFNERVDRNEDWNNSEEYKKYINSNKSTFYENGISVKYSYTESVYHDSIDQINESLLKRKNN